MDKYKNIPKQVHLIPDSSELNNSENNTIDFNDFEHEFTYWAQGVDKKTPDLNYVQQKEMDKLKKKIYGLIHNIGSGPRVNSEKIAYNKLVKLLK